MEIEALLKDGQTQRTVASKIGVSQNCVKKVAKMIRECQSLKNAPGQGRKRASPESICNTSVRKVAPEAVGNRYQSG